MKRPSKLFRTPTRRQSLNGRLRGFFRSTGATVDHLIVRKFSATRRPTLRQFSYLVTVLSFKERRELLILIFIALLSGTFVFRQLWHWTFFRAPQPGGTYTEGIVGAPELLNPLYAIGNDADRDITRLLFAGLIRFNERGEAIPDLAETIATEDGATFTITLRQGLTWSDGEPVTTDDVRFTFEAIKNPSYRSPLKSNFNTVQIETVDAHTLRLVLPTTTAPFLENLTVGILPAHVWASVDPKNALLTELNRKPVSAGPYRFEVLAKDPEGNIRSYTLARRTSGVPHVPFIERIVFKFYPDFDEAGQALHNRNIDGLALLPPDTLARSLKARPELVHRPLMLPHYTAIFLNAKSNEVLTDVRIRTALAHAIDRDKILREVIHGEGELIEGPILPGTLGYDPAASTTPFDLIGAGNILDEKGWTLPEGATVRVHRTSQQPLSLSLTTVAQPEQLHTAEIVQRLWQQLGIKVDLHVIDPTRIFELIRGRDYNALLITEITGVDPDPYPFWHSSALGEQGLNLANFSDREADVLLEDARKTVDTNTRADHYRAFQRIIAREMPAVFLYTAHPPYVIDQKVKGVTLIGMANPADRFAYIDRWFINTQWIHR